MSTGFDPYHKWLGIPPDEQPPHHYRLLAIRVFEEDPDVIESAADRLMAHLRTHQTGKHSALSQKLLNEAATAKICLLNPERKQLYDAQLRQWLEHTTAQPERRLLRAQPLPQVDTSAEEIARELSFLTESEVQSAGHHLHPGQHVHHPSPAPVGRRPVVLAAAILAGALLVTLVFLLARGRPAAKTPAVAEGPASEAPAAAEEQPPLLPLPASAAAGATLDAAQSTSATTSVAPPSTPPTPSTAEPLRVQGELVSVVSHADETHVVVQPDNSSVAVEAFTRAAQFDRQLVDYLARGESAASQGESVLLEAQTEGGEEPAFRLLANATPLRLKALTRRAAVSSRAEVGRPRDAATLPSPPPLAPLTYYARNHPAPGAVLTLPLRFQGYAVPSQLMAAPAAPVSTAGTTVMMYTDAWQNWLRERVALVLPNRTEADFADYALNDRILAQVTVARESTPAKLVLQVNAVYREADPEGSRITPAGRDRPPLDLRADYEKWMELRRNATGHEGESVVLCAQYMGLQAQPAPHLRLYPHFPARRSPSTSNTISPSSNYVIDVPWRATPERSAWLSQLRPDEELLCEIVLVGEASNRPQVEARWLARRETPAQRLVLEVRDWRDRPGVQVLAIRTGESSLKWLLWTPDGKSLIGAGGYSNSSVFVWDAGNGQRLQTLNKPPDLNWSLSDLGCNPQGTALVATVAGGVLSWNLREENPTAIWMVPKPRYVFGDTNATLAWSPDGGQLAFMQYVPPSEGKAKWNFILCATGRPPRLIDSIISDSSKEYVLRWSGGRTPRLVVGAPLLGNLRFYSSQGADLVNVLLINPPGAAPANQPSTKGSFRRQAKAVPQRPGRQLYDLAWSSDGNQLAIAGEMLEVWNLSKDPVLKQKYANPDGQLFKRVSWSPDGTRVAGTWEQGIAAWNVETGAIQFTIPLRNQEPLSTWSPSAERLAAADSYGTIFIYRTGTDAAPAGSQKTAGK